MIERIQKIKNIGTFKDAQLANHAFNKTTIVYGGNSQGKSTLCDIIKSLGSNVPAYLEERKTVGSTGSPQVDISFGDRKCAKFASGAWTISADLAEASNIVVFDNEFVHDNVFTNSTINRENKEQFTKFVLGSDSIIIECTLSNLQAERAGLEEENKKIEKRLLPAVGMTIKELCAITYSADIHDEDAACLGLDQNIRNLKSDLKNIEAIKSMTRPKAVSFADNITGLFQRINATLLASYNFSHDDIVARFQEHKSKHGTVSPLDFDKWIGQGRQLQNNSDCPYCGKSTDGNYLVESYIALFCDDFIAYTATADKLLVTQIPTDIFIKLDACLNDNEVKAEKISKKVYAENISDLLNELLAAKNKICEIVAKCDESVKTNADIFAAKKAEKNTNKYAEVTAINTEELESNFSELGAIITRYNACLDAFLAEVELYFTLLSAESIAEKIKEFEKGLKRLTAIVNRHKFNDTIIEYQANALNSEIKRLESKKLKAEFDAAQALFLETFFVNIDNYFSRLGSRNYKIDKETNARGTNKVYTLKLYFRDKEVENDKIKFVLSDSDKRALALSIFLSKLKHKVNLQDTIIVMDDPITSFDSERMTLFINILKEFDGSNQVIILTHYKDFYKKLVELMYAVDPKPSLLKIIMLPDSNLLERVDKHTDALLMSDYENYLHNMSAFIRGETHTYSSTDARLLMQRYLEYRFYHEIVIRGISSARFESFLTALHDAGLISDDAIFRRLNNKREEYNMSAHTFDTELEDAKRNSIVDLQNLLSLI